MRSAGKKADVVVAQASAYGKCVFRDYNNVFKDKCLAEFLRLKECVVVGVLDMG